MRNLGKLLCILGIATLSGVNASAQQITASIRGTVVDPSGGVVQGASVNAKQTETGLSRTAMTDRTGAYILLEMPVIFFSRFEFWRRTGYEARTFRVVVESLAQFVDGGVQAVIEIDKRVGWPQAFAELFPANHFARTFEKNLKNVERAVLELNSPPILAEFCPAKSAS